MGMAVGDSGKTAQMSRDTRNRHPVVMVVAEQAVATLVTVVATHETVVVATQAIVVPIAHQIPTAQDVVANLGNKCLFTVLDQKDSYWQVPLSPASVELCTFNTPFGRYSFQRMPFGICSASEVLQKRNYHLFGDIDGVQMMSDDMIIATKTEAEHDTILRKVMDRARKFNVKFNKDKMKFKVTEVVYLGNIVSKQGLRPDEEKIRAIRNMPDPQCKLDLQRIMGMFNYLSQFIPDMSSTTSPLRGLLKKDSEWMWGPEHVTALKKLKQTLSSKPLLRFFDETKPIVIQCDASSTGLGACLLQNGQPVVYSSRSLTDPEKNYAQIEKELLAICFSVEKFHHYVYGHQTTVHSDHKPLEAIIKKPLHKASPRLQLMLLRLLKYRIEIVFVPGKLMHIADALSRAYSDPPDSPSQNKSEEMELRVHNVITHLPMSEQKILLMREATAQDEALQAVISVCKTGWPVHKWSLKPLVRPYWPIHDDIHEVEGLVFVGDKLLIPSSLRGEMLNKIHETHLGMEKCKARARELLYWPGMTNDIEELVRRANQREPMIPHQVPERPWSKVAADIFTLDGRDYMVVVDYYSKYPEVVTMPDKTGTTVVRKLKAIFARHGVPDTFMSDNMPFASRNMIQFAKEWEFQLVTSSPTYPRSNGLSERFVQTVKSLFKKAAEEQRDPYKALLDFRNTPIAGLNSSPAQLLMSRRLKSNLPTHSNLLQPNVVLGAKSALQERQMKQESYYNRGTKPLPDITPGETVRLKQGKVWQPVVVSERHRNPRSHVVQSGDGQMYRRNRQHLQKTREPPMQVQHHNDSEDINPPPYEPAGQSLPATPTRAEVRQQTPAVAIPLPTPAVPMMMTRSRTSGRIIRPPPKLRDYVLT